MSNLVDIISNWFERYRPNSTSERKAISTLVSTLSSVDTLEELGKALKKDFNNPHFSQAVFSKIKEWHALTNTILQYHANAEVTLSKCVQNDLIVFIQDTLALPGALLHISTNNFLHLIVNQEQLEEVMNFVYQLPNAAPRSHPQKGSFEALEPENPRHAHIIGLLRNNSAFLSDVYQQRQTKNPLADKANSLLQSLLIVHAECLKPRASVIYKENQHESQSSCRLM